jgi:hypothetical protein
MKRRRNVVLLLALATSMLATIAAAQTRAVGDRDQRQARPAVFSSAHSAQLQLAGDHRGQNRDDRAYYRGGDRDRYRTQVRVYGARPYYYGGYAGGYAYQTAPTGYYDQWGVWHPYGWYDTYGYWHPYR